MNLNSRIQKLRPYPQTRSLRFELIFSACIVLLGGGMGLVAKMTDSISMIGEIGTELGIWVFVAALIAAYSRYPISAAINVFLFFVSMLAAYYIYGFVVLNFFPKAYFFGWLVVALISPAAGFLAWFSRAKGITGSIVAALPVALLFAHGYPAFYTSRIPLYFSLIMGAALCVLLPQTIKYKAIAFGVSIPIAFLINKLYLLRFFPF